MAFKGIFSLQNSQNLLQKLEWDYDLLTKDPLNVYHAFNFFVTAEHLVDWYYPNDENKRKSLRRKLDLQICSHIANGSKHFEATAKRHKSVKGTQIRPSAAFGELVLGVSRLGVSGGLEIRLKGYAKRKLGEYIDAQTLAKRIVEFWNDYFKKHPI